MTHRHRSAPDIASRAEMLASALRSGGDRLDPVAVDQARRVLARTDERVRLGAEHTVVALAGSTGSGKSSLFNALAGTDVAQVGARRPTTASPTACIWGEGADELLDWLEVASRHRCLGGEGADAQRGEDLSGLVLLDLPDHDSTRLAHRLEVDRLVDLADLLVWVVDPQKYADEALHAGYLRSLSGHADVMLFVLNQVDRLTPEAVAQCRRDLARLLADDGLPGVRVLTTSVVTGAGLVDLRAEVVDAVRRRDAVAERAAADLDAAVAALATGVGPAEAAPAAIGGAGTLLDALVVAAGVPAVLDAVSGDYRRAAAGHVGWPFSRWVRHLRPDPLRRLRLGSATTQAVRLERSSRPEPTQAQRAQVDLATRRVAESAAAGLPPRWAEAVRTAAAPARADLADALDQAVSGVGFDRRRPRWWRLVGALHLGLAAAAVVGAGWLVVLSALAWLRVTDVTTPRLGPVALPTLLLAGGLLGGLVLALVGRRLAAWGARRRRRRTQERLRQAVHQAAAARVLDPVSAVLADHRATRLALGLRR